MGKQGLPPSYRRAFDIITCSGSLGTNLLPAKCFELMLSALKPGGHLIFTVGQKHLSADTNSSFGMGYSAAIQSLIDRGSWRPVQHREFTKCHAKGLFEQGESKNF